jgi:hypothetical protein
MYLKAKLVALTVGSAAALALAGGSAAAGIVPGAAGIGIRAALPPGFHAAQAAVKGATQVGSTNWSGYAQVGKKTKVFTAVKGTWTVPTVKVESGTQYSSDWVGIDGAFNNSTLIQDGTEGDNIGGKVKYDAWTEIIPASEVVTPAGRQGG